MVMDHKHRGKTELLRVLKSRERLIDEMQDRSRRLLGWRLRFEKLVTPAGERQIWIKDFTVLLTKIEAWTRARVMRQCALAYRNVRVLRVYRKKRSS